MPIPHELVCLSNLSPHATILYIDGGGKGYIHSDTCGAEGEGYKRGKGILEGGGGVVPACRAYCHLSSHSLYFIRTVDKLYWCNHNNPESSALKFNSN